MKKSVKSEESLEIVGWASLPRAQLSLFFLLLPFLSKRVIHAPSLAREVRLRMAVRF